MRFSLLVLGAAAATAAPSRITAPCDASACTDVLSEVQCLLGTVTNPSGIIGCVAGGVDRVCSCAACLPCGSDLTQICGAGGGSTNNGGA